MCHSFKKFLKTVEQWEKYQSSSFWLCSVSLYIAFSTGFGALFPESPSQDQVVMVIEQVRGGGGMDDLGSSISSPYRPPGISNAYLPPSGTNPGSQGQTINSSPKQPYEPKPGTRIGMGNNPGDNGNGSSSWEEKNTTPPKENWNTNAKDWNDIKSQYKLKKKKREDEEEVLSRAKDDGCLTGFTDIRRPHNVSDIID